MKKICFLSILLGLLIYGLVTNSYGYSFTVVNGTITNYINLEPGDEGYVIEGNNSVPMNESVINVALENTGLNIEDGQIYTTDGDGVELTIGSIVIQDDDIPELPALPLVEAIIVYFTENSEYSIYKQLGLTVPDREDLLFNVVQTDSGFTVVPETAPVPEPATLLLLGSGLVGLVGLTRKFKK